jgi:translation elongation factor EF-Tu-like GTPase
VEQAEQADGAIVTVASADGNFEQGKQLVDMMLHVTRANRVYDVHLQVDMTTRAGKILRADGL